MLSDQTKTEIKDFYGRISGSLPGFKRRYGQREMIGAIASTLMHARSSDAPATGKNIVVVEGKTGVGKTIGYLVPAIVMAKTLRKKLVLATGTVALQEQLFNRDLPAVASHATGGLTFALAKGRSRYVCLSRLDKMTGGTSQDGLFVDAAWDRKPDASEVHILKDFSRRFGKGEWNGDRDVLAETVPNELWARVSTDAHGCSRGKCPEFKECPYYKARAHLNGVDVIVANHDLVLSVLASESTLLPPPGDTIYVFDEAHNLPETTIDRFTLSASVNGAIRWIERFPVVAARINAVLPADSSCGSIAARCESLAEELGTVDSSLRHSDFFGEAKVLRFKNGTLTGPFLDLAESVAALAGDLSAAADSMQAAVVALSESDPSRAKSLEPIMGDLGFFVGRSANLAAVWSSFVATPPADAAPAAKWISVESEGKAADFKVNVAPVSAAATLSTALWGKASACVLTSATITSLGSFDYFLSRSGLAKFADTTTLEVCSPFDYQAQGELVIPRMSSDPSNADAHTEELKTLLPAQLSAIRAGALMLFASKKQMLAVHAAMPAELLEHILLQGSASRAEILRKHAANIEAGKPSILFGLSSMGEGLDLPGRLCETVLVAKIPFSPPDSPIDEAISEWIESRGGRPFFELSLPKAGLKLIQWSGRLIRTEEDFGRVVIFDRRMTTKAYGKMLLAGLPDFRRG